MRTDQRDRKGTLALYLGLAVNVLLAAAKTSIGVLGHSQALLAEGINSTSDVAYYLVVGVFMRLAGKPPDDEHPYGHSQLESIGALVVGSFVVTTAIAIFWDSVNMMYDVLTGVADFGGATSLTLWIALLTVAVKIVMTRFTLRIGRDTNNIAVMALAYDHRNDIYSAAAAAIGIFLGRQGYLWVDPLAGAVVSLVILRTGIEVLRESTSDLMDTIPGRALSAQIHDLLSALPEVEHIDEIQAHRFGPNLVVNITICVSGAISVAEGDNIATRVENLLLNNIDFMHRVHVHYHPVQDHQG